VNNQPSADQSIGNKTPPPIPPAESRQNLAHSHKQRCSTIGWLSNLLQSYFLIGSKLRCIRSTPTEMQSMSENDFECLASTGVNTPLMAKNPIV